MLANSNRGDRPRSADGVLEFSIPSDQASQAASRRVSSQHLSAKEYSLHAPKRRSWRPRPRPLRFFACPRRPQFAIVAAGLSIASGSRASVRLSSRSIRSTPLACQRRWRDSSLLCQCPSHLPYASVLANRGASSQQRSPSRDPRENLKAQTDPSPDSTPTRWPSSSQGPSDPGQFVAAKVVRDRITMYTENTAQVTHSQKAKLR